MINDVPEIRSTANFPRALASQRAIIMYARVILCL